MMRTRSLYVKFNVLIVGTICLCGIIISSLMLYTTSSSMEHELDQSGREIAASISTIISENILVDDQFAMTEQLLATQRSNDQIRYILVARPDGQIVASTFTDGLPAGLPPVRLAKDSNDSTATYNSNEGYIREIISPIDDGLVGYFRIGLSEQHMITVMRKRFLEIMFFIVLICFMASLLATRYAHAFLTPIRHMAKAVRQISLGNYTVQVPVETRDDLGHLAKVFNSMVSRLETKDKENAHLLAELQEKEKLRLWLISQLFSAREDERRRISRELHDETSQSMVSMLAYLRLIQDRIENEETRGLVEDVRGVLKETLEGLRHLAVTLHPPLLDDLGLVVAIEKYLDTFRKTQPHMQVTLTHTGDFSYISHPIALLCYRMLQEGLTNIVRHAQADVVHISLTVQDDWLTISIADNGIGFSEDTAEKARLDNHLGIVSMRERAALLNGTFHIDSMPTKGTTLTISLPLSTTQEV